MAALKKSLGNLLLAAVYLCLQHTTAAAADPTPVGLWKTIDDSTSQPKGLVRLSERNGQFEGKIEKIFPKPGDDPAPKCDKCDSTRHNHRCSA